MNKLGSKRDKTPPISLNPFPRDHEAMITLTLVIGVLLLLAAFALYTQATFFANSTGTYQTTVTDKMEQQTVIYAGAFIPMKIFSIKTSENMEIKVERNRYLRVSIGDYVTVTSYSNGLHRLQL